MNRKELEKVLKEALVPPAPRATMFGIVRKLSEDTVQFCHPGPEDCTEVPLGLIEEAELVGHMTHEGTELPVMKVTLKEPTDPEAKVIFSLLVASTWPSRAITEPPPPRIMYMWSRALYPWWPIELYFFAIRSGMEEWRAWELYLEALRWAGLLPPPRRAPE